LCGFFPPHLFPFFSVLHFLFNLFSATIFFWVVVVPKIGLTIFSHPVYVSEPPHLPFFNYLQSRFYFQVISKSGFPYSILPGFSFYNIFTSSTFQYPVCTILPSFLSFLIPSSSTTVNSSGLSVHPCRTPFLLNPHFVLIIVFSLVSVLHIWI
jgi:hypothetical protein